MADPTFHLVGNFVELNQVTGGPKYLRKDDILCLNTSTHRVTIYMKSRPDAEILSFINSENQQRFVQQLLMDASCEETSFKECLNAVKDAMENVKRIQTDLSASLENVTTKIQEMKEDVKKDLQEYIDESLESEPEPEPESEKEEREKNPYDILDDSPTDSVCNTLIMFVTIILMIFGIISLQKNLKVI
jgi:hypothetical protein